MTRLFPFVHRRLNDRCGRSSQLHASTLRWTVGSAVVLVVASLWLAPGSLAGGGGFAAGELFVADQSRVLEYTADHAVTRTIVHPGFRQVFDLAFSPSAQELYVTDAIAHDVTVLDGSGS